MHARGYTGIFFWTHSGKNDSTNSNITWQWYVLWNTDYWQTHCSWWIFSSAFALALSEQTKTTATTKIASSQNLDVIRSVTTAMLACFSGQSIHWENNRSVELFAGPGAADHKLIWSTDMRLKWTCTALPWLKNLAFQDSFPQAGGRKHAASPNFKLQGKHRQPWVYIYSSINQVSPAYLRHSLRSND